MSHLAGNECSWLTQFLTLPFPGRSGGRPCNSNEKAWLLLCCGISMHGNRHDGTLPSCPSHLHTIQALQEVAQQRVQLQERGAEV